MARPTARETAKSAVLNIRVTPSLKAKLEGEARRTGNKVSTECENRLVQSMAQTDKATSPMTRDLLQEIENTIDQIERGAGSRWHDDIATWAAVSEMLGHGPILQYIPKNVMQYDEEISAVDDSIKELHRERERIVARLDFIGIELPPSLGGLVYPIVTDSVRGQIEALDLEPLMKERALAEVGRLDELDIKQRRITNAANSLVEPFVNAVRKGRQYYERQYPPRVVGMILTRLEMERMMNAIASLGGGSAPVSIDSAIFMTSMALKGEFLRTQDEGKDDFLVAPQDPA